MTAERLAHLRLLAHFATYVVPPNRTEVWAGYLHDADAGDDILALCAAVDVGEELLAACKAALAWHGLDGDHISDPVRSQLLAAIAKAEGRS